MPPGRSRYFRRRTISSGRAKSPPTSATTGIGKTATRRTRWGSGKRRARPIPPTRVEGPKIAARISPIGPRQNAPPGSAPAGGRGGRGAGSMNNVAAFQQTLDDSRLKGLELYYQMARLQSTKNFLVMPNEELFGITGAAPENQFP